MVGTGTGAQAAPKNAAPSRAVRLGPLMGIGSSTKPTQPSTRHAGSGLSRAEEYEILLSQIEDCRAAGWHIGTRIMERKGRRMLVIVVGDVPNEGGAQHG